MLLAEIAVEEQHAPHLLDVGQAGDLGSQLVNHRLELGDGLFELRFSLGPTARRITYRFTKDGRIILLTTFRKQRNNERAEIARARRAAEDCARTNP